jgi:hypothetical protein
MICLLIWNMSCKVSNRAVISALNLENLPVYTGAHDQLLWTLLPELPHEASLHQPTDRVYPDAVRKLRAIDNV